MVPPLRLVSAAIWQTIQLRHVMDYGMLEEFVTMVTEMVPELLNLRQRAQLILGLRARLVLELCRSKPITDLQTIQPHLDRIQTLTPLWGTQVSCLGQRLSYCLNQSTLLKDPDERNHFFQDIFPVEFGPSYDTAIQNLMWQFLSRLEKLLPMSNFQQVLVEIKSYRGTMGLALRLCGNYTYVLSNSIPHCQASSLLGDVPSVLEECVDITGLSFGSLFPSFTDPPSSTDGDCILSALCLPPGEWVVIATEVEKEGKSMGVKEREERVDSRTGECEKNKRSSVSDEEKPFKLLKKHPQKKGETHGEKCRITVKPGQKISIGVSEAIMSSMIQKPSVDLQGVVIANVTQAPKSSQKVGRAKRSLERRTCKVCGKVVQQTLAVHKVEHKPVQCTMCEKSFNVIRYLSRHYVDDHQFSGPFRCTYCERSYADLAALIRHQRIHTGGEPPYKCSHCPKKFHFETALVTHQRNHTGEKPCLCWECGKTFQSKGILKSHMNRVHTPQVKRIPCSQCTKVFRDKGQMKMHENVYHKGLRYPCSYCGKGFYSPAPLARHVLIHTGENPYSCTYKECTRVFKSASELRIHMRYHTGERPFKCKDCGKGFVQAHYLTIHRRSHTGEKPYPCLTCDKSFGTSHQLSRHMKTHTGEKPYQCMDCGKAFNRGDRLRTHQDKCHPAY
uniref:Zinc finger protein 665-like n=1 Tax=Salmo trutta TaxID=8032 RepID=A0A674BPR8_SALTR